MQSAYLDIIGLVERLHRRFLEVVKLELETNRVYDINNVQAMILHNIGDLDLSVGELTASGCYLGSNITYNLKKMLESGYIVQERSSYDRRSIRVRLTEKGMDLHRKMKWMHERHLAALSEGVVPADDLVAAQRALRRLDRFWQRTVDLALRASTVQPAA